MFLTFPVFFSQNTAIINVSTPSRNPQKNEGAPEFWCPGTRTLMPFQVDNWFFIVISRMDIRNINLSFFSSVFMCPWHFLVISEYCQQKLRIHNQENTKKIVGAPEFWCPGTRTLVPFQVDNCFFIVISRMDIRNINLSFFPSVLMCSWHFLFFFQNIASTIVSTPSRTPPPKMRGHQSSGARAPELWCPFQLKTGFLF